MGVKFNVQIIFERCKGCELCVGVCPVHILQMTERVNSCGNEVVEVMSQDKCIGCCQCSEICPDSAIEVSRRTTDADGGPKKQQ